MLSVIERTESGRQRRNHQALGFHESENALAFASQSRHTTTRESGQGERVKGEREKTNDVEAERRIEYQEVDNQDQTGSINQTTSQTRPR